MFWAETQKLSRIEAVPRSGRKVSGVKATVFQFFHRAQTDEPNRSDNTSPSDARFTHATRNGRVSLPSPGSEVPQTFFICCLPRRTRPWFQ